MIWFLAYLAAGYFTTCKMLEYDFAGAAASETPGRWIAFTLCEILWPVIAAEMLMQYLLPIVEDNYPNFDAGPH